jgi:hypothetical protein
VPDAVPQPQTKFVETEVLNVDATQVSDPLSSVTVGTSPVVVDNGNAGKELVVMSAIDNERTGKELAAITPVDNGPKRRHNRKAMSTVCVIS